MSHDFLYEATQRLDAATRGRRAPAPRPLRRGLHAALPACGGLKCLCRTRFFPGQLLTDDDLNRLEQYVIDKTRLHNRYLHGLGRGLRPRIRLRPLRARAS